MQTLTENPPTINDSQLDDFEHIAAILPGVLASIVESAQLQHNPERTEHRSYPLRWAA